MGARPRRAASTLTLQVRQNERSSKPPCRHKLCSLDCRHRRRREREVRHLRQVAGEPAFTRTSTLLSFVEASRGPARSCQLRKHPRTMSDWPNGGESPGLARSRGTRRRRRTGSAEKVTVYGPILTTLIREWAAKSASGKRAATSSVIPRRTTTPWQQAGGSSGWGSRSHPHCSRLSGSAGMGTVGQPAIIRSNRGAAADSVHARWWRRAGGVNRPNIVSSLRLQELPGWDRLS